MRRRLLFVALAGGVLLGTGCQWLRGKPRCDEAKLAEAADAMESERSEVAKSDALDALAEACPELNQTLWHGLSLDYGDPQSVPTDQMLQAIQEDEAFHAIRRRACPAIDELGARVAEGEAPPDDGEKFRACEFDRFGLLEGDERYTARKFSAFLLASELSDRQVDPAIARRFIRALLDRGLLDRLPRSTIRHGAGGFGGTRVRVDGTGIAVDDRLAVALDEHALPAGSIEHGSIKPLVPLLEDALGVAERLATEREMDPERRLVLTATADVSCERVVQIMFSARKSGFDEFVLQVRSSRDDLAELPVAPRKVWFTSPLIDPAAAEREPERTPEVPVLRVTTEVYRLTSSLPEVGDVRVSRSGRSAAEAAEELRGWLQNLIEHDDRARTLAIQAAPALSLQEVVDVIDLARGARCDEMSEDAAGCLFFRVMLDTEPVLRFWERDWDAIELEVARVRSRDPKSPLKAAMNTVAKELLPEVQACIREQTSLAEIDARKVFIHLGVGATGKRYVLAGVSGTGTLESQTRECIEQALVPHEKAFSWPDEGEQPWVEAEYAIKSAQP